MGVESSILDLRNCGTYELGKWYAGRSWLPELLIQSPIPGADTWLAYAKLLSEEYGKDYGWGYKATKLPDHVEPWFERTLLGIHQFCVEADGDVAIDVESWRYELPVCEWPTVGSVYESDDVRIQRERRTKGYSLLGITVEPLRDDLKRALRAELRKMVGC